MDFRKKGGELAELDSLLQGHRMPINPIIADLYVDVPIECGEMRTSIICSSDIIGMRLHFEGMPEIIATERPALYLACPYGIYEKGNPGWHQIILTGYAAGKEPVTEELLWHKDRLEYRSKLLAKIREMSKQLAGIQ
ncbi:MAG: hypothetical protein QME12_01875 [Nanoarchaeota archaeon]|nr:hypothetical protein [Nanoarchaeota archaeon]